MTVVPGVATPGIVLSGARKAAGMSIADIAAQLRLSPRQVAALEADRYEDLPGAVFVRGFIRNYARVLKLDPVPLLHALEPPLDEEAPLRVRATSGTLPLSARRDHARPLLILFCSIFIAVVAAGGYELWSRQREQTSKPNEVAGAGSRATQTVIVAAEKMQQSIASVAPPSNAAPEPAPPANAAIESQAATAAVPSEQAAAHAAIAASNARMGRLRVQFTAETWLEVRDGAGALVYSGTGQAGTERAFEAVAPVSMVIGNSSGVRITYNGEPLDLSTHAARNVARLTLE